MGKRNYMLMLTVETAAEPLRYTLNDPIQANDRRKEKYDVASCD